MSALPYLVAGSCPKGEHMRKEVPVACVPNKNAETRERGEPFPAFP